MRREIIAEARREKRLTQKQLAELIGVRPSTVQNWEAGKILTIHEDEIRKLHRLLGIPEDELRALNQESLKMGGPAGYQMGKREEAILKAWQRGERTVDEICEITGYSRAIVTRYIPG